jgi:hypothetical protein
MVFLLCTILLRGGSRIWWKRGARRAGLHTKFTVNLKDFSNFKQFHSHFQLFFANKGACNLGSAPATAISYMSWEYISFHTVIMNRVRYASTSRLVGVVETCIIYKLYLLYIWALLTTYMYSPAQSNINTCVLKYFVNHNSYWNAVTAIWLEILLATRW